MDMSSITDWLTSIGTIAAVVVSLSYVVVGNYMDKRRKRHNLILRMRYLSEKLFNEIREAPQSQGDISKLKTYETFKIYQTIVMFSVNASNEDVLTLAQHMLSCFEDYFSSKSQADRDVCSDVMRQINEMK